MPRGLLRASRSADAPAAAAPQADVQLHSFENGTSQHYKQDNWAQLRRCCARQGIALPEPLVAGTMAGAHGAAVALMTHLYQTLTGKRWARARVQVHQSMAAHQGTASSLHMLPQQPQCPLLTVALCHPACRRLQQPDAEAQHTIATPSAAALDLLGERAAHSFWCHPVHC